ncbi:MAG TPA: DUF3105 domain-containing protein [Candidatus Limnocylindrales bacterium]|nr:DUF3105 domain-containing protein [Candidatus Limnocylindrales bacterium]
MRKDLLYRIYRIGFGLFLLSLPCLQVFAQEKSPADEFSVPVMPPVHIHPGQAHAPYNTIPPTSGPHVEIHVGQKILKTPVPEEIQVHELEHGGIFIQYNCTHCDDLVAKLEKIAQAYEGVFVAPYPKMDTLIALTAWGKLAKLKEYNEEIIQRFIKSYLGAYPSGK